jgi:tetratricopeptide (TPR) repeat protein
MSSGPLATTCVAAFLSATGAAIQAQDSARPARMAAAQTKPAPDAIDPVPPLEQALAKNPDDPKVNVALGVAYLERGDGARALARLQHAVKIAPDSADAHNWLGVALLDRADFPQGIASLRKAVALDPKHSRAYANLGSALAKSGELDEAVDVFRKALALESESLPAHFNLGMALREKGDFAAALPHLRRVAAADPGNASLHYELGQALRQSGELGGAIAAFERALEIDPELREAYYALGATLKQQSVTARKLGPSAPGVPRGSRAAEEAVERAKAAVASRDFKTAEVALAEALRLDADHAEAHTLQGFVLGQQGNLAAALPHLQRATVLRPEWPEARHNLGAALWYSGAREKAIAELRESVRLDPGSAGGHGFLGMALRETGDLPGARASLQRAMALAPAMAAAYVDLAVIFLRAGNLEQGLGQLEAGLNVPVPVPPPPDWDAAIAALRQAVVSSPKRPESHQAQNLLGLMLGRKGAPGDDVLSAFRAAIRLRPDYAEAHNNLGLVLIQSGKDEEGIAALREAVRLAPAYAEARTNLGAALTSTDAEAGIKELEEALRLAPGSVKALFNLAVAYGTSPAHGPTKEIEHLEKVIELAPDFPRAHLALGKALLQEGKAADAVAALQNAVKLAPDSGEANYQLGLALVRAGRKEEAAAQLKKGRDLVAADDRAQNAVLDLADGRAALERKDFDEAVSKFRRAGQLRPESAEPQRLLGVALEGQGDTAGAAAAYEKALALSPHDASARRSLETLRSRPGVATAPQAPIAPVTLTSGSGVSDWDDRARMTELEGFIRDAKWTDVEPLLLKYVAERPKSSWGWYALGYAYFAQKKIGDSIKALATSLQLDLKNVEAHKILGRNLMIVGRFDAAQVEFEQAIRYKPDSAENHYNLGKLFSMQDNWEPARTAFEAALRIDPAYLEALDGVGFALEALGDDAGAIAKYQEAIRVNEARGGHFAAAHVNLSAYYNRTGDPVKALDYARKAIELDPTSDRAWFQKAKADEHEGRLNDAASALSEAISRNPRSSSYYYVLAGVYRRLGWMDDSRTALEHYKRLDKESAELEKKRRSVASEAATTPPGRKRE